MAFCAPVLFRSIGFGLDWALIGAVILGVVNLVLFLEASVQIVLCQLVSYVY